jgi:hypothetical protein
LPSWIAKRSNDDPNKTSHSNRQDQERKAVSRKVEPTSHRPVNSTGGTAILIRTGKHRSAIVIISRGLPGI